MGRKSRSAGNGAAAEASLGLARALSLGTNLAAGMAVFTLIGYWFDKRGGAEGAGLWTLAGMLAGLAYGAYEVWKVVRMLNRNTGAETSGSTGERKS